MEVYLRKLHNQELSYRDGAPGARGRYFLISKRFAAFFPPLSENILNDSVLLEVVPPFSDDVVFSNFVYHNSKHANNQPNGRDEYRFYLNVGIDQDSNYYKPDDIIAITKSETETEEIYKIYRYNLEDNRENYLKLNELLEEEGENKSHLLVESDRIGFLNLPETFTVSTDERILPEPVKPLAFEQPIFDTDRRTYTVGNQTKKIRSQSFRDLVMLFYDYKCAITGEEMLIEYNNSSNLQAAHIVAVGHNGGDNPANGIPLIMDLHWAFENGFFTITDDYKIQVHPETTSEWLRALDGKTLHLPEDSRAKPHPEALKWHRENFYGRFKRS